MTRSPTRNPAEEIELRHRRERWLYRLLLAACLAAIVTMAFNPDQGWTVLLFAAVLPAFIALRLWHRRLRHLADEAKRLRG